MIRIRTILLTMAAAVSLSSAIVPASAAPPFGDRGGGGFPLGGRGGITLNIPAAPSNGDRRCLSEAEIEAAISSGRIQSWAKIRALANIPKEYRETSDVQVCLRGGTPYFIVSMVSPKGEYFKIVLNAVDGSS
jgi:hypothetical protein